MGNPGRAFDPLGARGAQGFRGQIAGSRAILWVR